MLKLKHILLEVASQQAYKLHTLTSCGQDAAQDFMDANPNVNFDRLMSDLSRNIGELTKFEIRDIVAGKAADVYVKKFERLYGKLGGQLKERTVLTPKTYQYIIDLVLGADNPKSLPIYYNSDHNVVNIGGTGYDGGQLITAFNAKPGTSGTIKNTFYHANQDPQETKQQVERLSMNKITVQIAKGFEGKQFVKYQVS